MKNNLKKKKCEYVYSIFSREFQDYPYYPFFAKNNTLALREFYKFCKDRERICPEPELHLIATVYRNDDGSLFHLQRHTYVSKIDVENANAQKIYLNYEQIERLTKSFERFFLKLSRICLKNLYLLKKLLKKIES